jgi:SAM-dependent methyltransferase
MIGGSRLLGDSMGWSGQDLASMYARRFEDDRTYRLAVWRILIEDLVGPYLRPDMHVLDLGCGHGEFINQIQVAERFAMDLNPAASSLLDARVKMISQDCSTGWPLPDHTFDVIFSSNFFEHLPDKSACLRTWREAWRTLRPGGRLIALGPNIAALPGHYWDFFDHFVPLSDRSVCEGLQLAGFEIERRSSRTLPYSMSQGRRYPLWALRAYLKIPLAWPLFGKQFLVVARRAMQ